MGDSFDVIMAADPSVGPAQTDFDALVRLVKAKTIRTKGVPRSRRPRGHRNAPGQPAA
jgi:hypothetical protein